MGCGDECPVVPGAQRDDWPNPGSEGSAGPMRVAAIVADIEQRVRALIAAEQWQRPAAR